MKQFSWENISAVLRMKRVKWERNPHPIGQDGILLLRRWYVNAHEIHTHNSYGAAVLSTRIDSSSPRVVYHVARAGLEPTAWEFRP